MAGVCQSRRDVGAAKSANTRDRHLQQRFQLRRHDRAAFGRSNYPALGLARLLSCNRCDWVRLGCSLSDLQAVESEHGTVGPRAGRGERQGPMEGTASLPADLGVFFALLADPL